MILNDRMSQTPTRGQGAPCSQPWRGQSCLESKRPPTSLHFKLFSCQWCYFRALWREPGGYGGLVGRRESPEKGCKDYLGPGSSLVVRLSTSPYHEESLPQSLSPEFIHALPTIVCQNPSNHESKVFSQGWRDQHLGSLAAPAEALHPYGSKSQGL